MPDNTTAALVIKAAGGVIYRRDGAGNQVFALVHKRKYGEWCLPKGKLRPDEDWKEAAIREVNEETGAPSRIVGPTAVNGYMVKGTPKIVVFFAMEALSSPTFTPSREIDHVEWCNEAEVRRRLSHDGERQAFDAVIQFLSSRALPLQ